MSTIAAPESFIDILGVLYIHRKTSDGGDLYLTKFGAQHAELLEVENWYDPEWFAAHRERLEGTSAVYRVPTKEVKGNSLELVVKNCRVGEDVPVETRTLIEFINAEFNSPWEEFSLVMEMREGSHGPKDLRINTQLPFAIYVPPGKMQVWQSGRSQEKLDRIRAKHPGIDLDILRQYKLVYGWIKGKNVVRMLREAGVEGEELKAQLKALTARATGDMEKKGYVVMDMKPDHVIIGEEDAAGIEGLDDAAGGDLPAAKTALLRRKVEAGRYSVVDYELLIRTPPHEEAVKNSRRHSYLDDQRDRFNATPLPAHLKAVEIAGVPYVFGQAESTGGALWVVGRNARLFDYFLPERWRKTHSWRLSEGNEVYYTFTKDHIHIVWKTSRVGEAPPAEPAAAGGFNSPFEEFEIARDLTEKGVPTVYVRAIYMTGSQKVEPSVDLSRFLSHKDLRRPDGEPILRTDRNYITIRGYYNGPDGWVAQQRNRLCRPMDLVKALAGSYISPAEYRELFEGTLARLRAAGYDGSCLKGNDLILVLDPDNLIVKDREERPEVRLCNFSLLRRL